MNKIGVDVRLRPIRFAFLVRPDNRRGTLNAFRANTCLWGGRFNPIIPFFQQVPKWWVKKEFAFENAKQIVNGYLDFFEPDYLIETEKGMAESIGYEKKRIISIDDLFSKDREKRIGQSVKAIYNELYQKEFKFVRRHQPNILNVIPKDKSFASMCACLFGGFYTDKQKKDYERYYNETFNPKKITLTGKTLSKLYNEQGLTALHVGIHELQVDYSNHFDPTLFLFDGKENKDLIDLWNLRTVRRIVPIPVQYIADLKDFCVNFIKQNHKPIPGNPFGTMVYTTMMFGRSLGEEESKKIYEKYLRPEIKEGVRLQTWYPPIWRSSPEYVVPTSRAIITAEKRSVTVQVDGDEEPSIQFEPIFPSFLDRNANEHQFVNVVKLKEWGIQNKFATVFPSNYRNSDFPGYLLGDKVSHSSTEGIVSFPRFSRISQRWKLLDGPSSFAAWLKHKKFEVVPSESGNTALQIIESFNSLHLVKCIANKGILELLNGMSNSLTRSMNVGAFQNKIKTADGKDIWRQHTVEILVKNRAVELGLELRCAKCNSWGWHSIKNLKDKVECPLCLKSFEFPTLESANSKKLKWAYRVIGPFAVPNYSSGGYACALAVRFFSEILGRSSDNALTWATNLKMNGSGDNSPEVDFMLWYQRRHLLSLDEPATFVAGEAKSFGKPDKEVFTKEDINRLKSLAMSVPGTILVFATLREELVESEKEELKKLAEWGRYYSKETRQSRAPVIILTATELFSSFNLDDSWKHKGGKHKVFAEISWARTDNLKILADFTQQLYLEMPSYHEWQDARWKKREARRISSK